MKVPKSHSSLVVQAPDSPCPLPITANRRGEGEGRGMPQSRDFSHSLNAFPRGGEAVLSLLGT